MQRLLTKRFYSFAFAIPSVKFSHLAICMSQQFLCVPKVARIRCSLGPNIPELKRRASGFPGLVKPIPQHPVGERLTALVLNQPGALDLRRPAGVRSITWASSPVISMASFCPVLFCLRCSAPSRMSARVSLSTSAGRWPVSRARSIASCRV